MPIVNAPPGLRQIKMYDGTVYPVDRASRRMNVDNPEHAAAIDAMSGNGTAGLLTAQFREFGGGLLAQDGAEVARAAVIDDEGIVRTPNAIVLTEPEAFVRLESKQDRFSRVHGPFLLVLVRLPPGLSGDACVRVRGAGCGRSASSARSG